MAKKFDTSPTEPVEPFDPTCCAAGCPLRGTISEGPGATKRYCRFHYRAESSQYSVVTERVQKSRHLGERIGKLCRARSDEITARPAHLYTHPKNPALSIQPDENHWEYIRRLDTFLSRWIMQNLETPNLDKAKLALIDDDPVKELADKVNTTPNQHQRVLTILTESSERISPYAIQDKILTRWSISDSYVDVIRCLDAIKVELEREGKTVASTRIPGRKSHFFWIQPIETQEAASA